MCFNVRERASCFESISPTWHGRVLAVFLCERFLCSQLGVVACGKRGGASDSQTSTLLIHQSKVVIASIGNARSEVDKNNVKHCSTSYGISQVNV